MQQSVKNIIKRTPLFPLYIEYIIRKAECKRCRLEAEEELRRKRIPDANDVLNAYLKDMHKYMFSFSEWYDMYDLSEAEESEKERYISRLHAQKYYRKLNNPATRLIFRNKPQFLKHYSQLIHRMYLTAGPETSIDELRQILQRGDVIVKPKDGSLGEGIYKIRANDVKDSELNDLLSRCAGQECLIEECVKGHPSIQAFHPSSLNTIRVMTARDKNGIRLFASFIRFGVGSSVVDNAHAGGVFSIVDINTGTLISDAQNTAGELYACHPDSGLQFKGFSIPLWDEIRKTCIAAHALCDLPFVGWDVCITDKNEIEIIEGNHAPDVDVIQGPLKRGYREEFENVCNNFRTQRS